MRGLPRPLRNSQFSWLWAGQTVSSLGNGIFTVGLVALLVTRGDSGFGLGFSLAAQSLGFGLAVLIGGILADRAGRVPAMLIADTARMLATLALAIAQVSTHTWAVIVLSGVVGVGEGLFSPAYQAIVPDLVDADGLASANSLNAAGMQIGSIAGPAAGGGIVYLLGARATFAADAVTFLVSLLTLLTIYRSLARLASKPAPAPTGTPAAGPADGTEPEPTRLAADVRDGIAAVLRRRWVAVVVLQGTLQLLFVMGPVFLLVPLTLARLHSVHAYGFVVAVQAIGALGGSVLAARWSPRQPGTVAIGALALLGFEILVIVEGAPVLLLAASMAVTGAGYSIFAVYWSTALQRAYPAEQLGRVFSVDQFFTYGLAPLGLAITPLALRGFGFSVTGWIVLALLLLTSVVPLASRQVRHFADAEPRTTS